MSYGVISKVCSCELWYGQAVALSLVMFRFVCDSSVMAVAMSRVGV